MPAYFDYNATTPLHPAAREAWLEASDRCWHNASGLYREAAAVKHELELTREELGDLIGVAPERILFTSGATESNNTLFHHLAPTLPATARILTSKVEHPSVREPLKKHFRDRTDFIPTLADGSIDLDSLAKLLKNQQHQALTLMAANNESGTLHPWREVAELCKELLVPFHCDASQWLGKMPAEFLEKCDYLTGSAHKFGGPKGVGFLVLRDEDERPNFLTGGPQEEGRRAGTENYPAIAAMLAALKAWNQYVPNASTRPRDQFENTVQIALPGTRIIGQQAPRLWNTSMLILPRHDNRKWLARLSDRGFAISTGSACSAGHDGSSIVLHALGASSEEMRRVIRVSSGWDTTEQDWQALAEAIISVASDLDNTPNQRQKISL
jgi:cysteine desulfurase